MYGPWRQAEVLQEPRVQLSNGLDSTKGKPTSVPTTLEQSSARFHPLQVGKAGGELSRNLSDFGLCHAAGLISTWNPRLRMRLASLAGARAGLRRAKWPTPRS